MSKRSGPKVTASFIEPMLALSASSLPEGPAWEYELKLDGYRALAIKECQARSASISHYKKTWVAPGRGTRDL